MTNPATRATDGRVEFEGGYATGAGLYNGTDRPVVEAHPDGGYEVSYFYGGPTNEPKKYDYSQTGTSLFNVDLGGQDHTFHCGFKEKKRNLTVNAGTGGSVSPSGTNSYRVKKPIDITATPDNGYEFTGWTITEGDVTIKDPGSLNTTATLHNTNSTITANFESPLSISDYVLTGNNGVILSRGESYVIGTADWYSIAYGNGKYVAVGASKGNNGAYSGYITNSADGVNWSTPKRLVVSGNGSTTKCKTVMYASGKFVAAGLRDVDDFDPYSSIAISNDGDNWTFASKFSNTSYFNTYYGVAHGNCKYVAVGSYSNRNLISAVSTDAVSWSGYDVAGPGTGILKGIIFAQDVFWAFKNGTVYRSVDGITWTSHSMGGLKTCNSMAFGNGVFVAVGDDGYISTSTNGTIWGTAFMAGTSKWKSVIYSDGKFVVVGEDGYISFSNDGMSWSEPIPIRDNSGNKVKTTFNSILRLAD